MRSLIPGPSISPPSALAIFSSDQDKTSLPQRNALDAEQKRRLAKRLNVQNNLTGAAIGRLLGVTRQAVYSYLKQDAETQDA